MGAGLAHAEQQQRGRATGLALALLLVCITLFAYADAGQLGTVSYDDPDYVTHNPHLAGGLTWDGLRWALTSRFAVNWFPLTWASHMLDHELFGRDYGKHHWSSVALHTLNTVLLFAFLWRATTRRGAAFFVAAFFALHPLHVESVAWLSERKDVLSTACGLVALHLYVSYARAPRPLRMAWVALAFAASLAAKPMLVTLPFLLLLLDVWPLQRIDAGRLFDASAPFAQRLRTAGLGGLLREKLPLFALTLASILITLSVQSPAVVSVQAFSWWKRLASVPLAYATYLQLTLWPVDLIPVRLHPGPSISLGLGALLAAMLLVLCFAAWRFAAQRTYLLIGWLWFLGLLVPVIGLVQVGNQLVADRYAYLPIVGLFVAAAWAADDATRSRPAWRAGLVLGGLALLVLCGVATRAQVLRWQDSVSLFEWTVSVDSQNHFAYAQLGRAYDIEREDYERALDAYERAVALRSYHHPLLYTFARSRISAGHLALAERALRLQQAVAPDYAAAHVERARLAAQRGGAEQARRAFARALELAPEDGRALCEAGAFELGQGEVDAAERHFANAQRVAPHFARAHRGLARVALLRGDLEAAQRAAERAAAIQPEQRSTRRLLREIELLGRDGPRG